MCNAHQSVKFEFAVLRTAIFKILDSDSDFQGHLARPHAADTKSGRFLDHKRKMALTSLS